VKASNPYIQTREDSEGILKLRGGGVGAQASNGPVGETKET
jgi:hypothetical protein